MSTDGNLGTHEFCAALNGDDPEIVRSALKKFILIVRNERRQALIATELSANNFVLKDEEDEEETSSESERNKNSLPSPPLKKQKIEEWKLDSKSYNVPFVGTSIQRGSSGTVLHGEWPTGFLKAYLEISPQAQEFIHSMEYFIPPNSLIQSENNTRNIDNIKLQRLYIQALGELVTCAMPSEALLPLVYTDDTDLWRKYLEIDGGQQALASDPFPCIPAIKDFLPKLFSLINECNQAFINVKDEKRVDIHSQTSALVSRELRSITTAALIALTNLVYTSKKIARDIARGMSSMVHESVLSSLMRPNFVQHKKQSQSSGKEAQTRPIKLKGKEAESDPKTRACYILSPHWACLDLASALLKSNDPVVMSLIAASGNKERKVAPGILHHLLRWSLCINRHASVEDGFMIRLGRFLRSLRESLSWCFETESKRANGDPKHVCANTRLLIQLLKDDPLLRICDEATNTKMTEIHRDMSTMQFVAVEARQLLFCLLIDVTRSPFLRFIHSNTSTPNILLYKTLVNQLTRCIQMLVSSSYDTHLREKVLEYLQNTPNLLPYYFRSFLVFEPSPSFAYLAQISYIRFILERGPIPTKTIADNFHVYEDISEDWLLPTRLSKNHLTKAVQNSNPLVVIQMLKLIASILRRTVMLTESFSHEQSSIIRSTVQKRLPDIQTLLAIRSRFEPFQYSTSDTMLANQSNYFAVFYLCGALQLYRSTFEASTQVTQYDWTKLLPENLQSFKTTPVWFQNRLIQTLLSMYCNSVGLSNSSSRLFTIPSTKALQILILLRHQCDHPHTSHVIQRATINLLFILLQPWDGRTLTLEQQMCLQYECTLWSDCISSENVSFYCKQIESSQENYTQQAILVYFYWRKAFPDSDLASISFSPLLCSSLINIASNMLCYELHDVGIICNISRKMLDFQENPLLLASVIVQALSTTNPTSIEEKAVHDVINNLRVSVIARYSYYFDNKVCSIASAEHMAITSSHQTCLSLEGSQLDDKRREAFGFALSDGALSFIASVKMHIQLSAIKSIVIRDVDINESFRWLRRDLIYSLMGIKNGSGKLFLCGLSKSLDILRWDCIRSQVVRMVYSSSFSINESRRTHHGHIWSQNILKTVETYCTCKGMKTMNDTSEFLSSINLAHYLPRRELLTTFSLISSNIELKTDIDISVHQTAIGTLDDLLLQYEEGIGMENSPDESQLPFNHLMQLWITLSMRPCNGIFNRFISKLEHLIMSTLAQGDSIASVTLTAVIRRFFLPETIKFTFECEKYGLLELLLKNDIRCFSSAVMKELAVNDRVNLLDRAFLAATMICELVKQESLSSESVDSDFISIVAGSVVDAICHVLNLPDNIAPHSQDIWNGMYELMRLNLVPRDRIKIVLDLARETLQRAMTQTKKCLLKSEHNLIDVMCKLCLKEETPNAEFELILSSSNLYETALDRLFQILPHVLGRIPALDINEEMRDIVYLLNQVKTLMIKLSAIDNEYSFRHTTRFLISCLKNGIHDDMAPVSTYCLELLLLMIQWRSKQHGGLSILPLSVGQIFMMAVSHSKFHLLLSSDVSKTKEYLIRLLIACVSRDSSIQAERDVFVSLLSRFNAGVGREDRLLHKLLYHLCENHASEPKSTMPMSMAELMWGEFQDNDAKYQVEQSAGRHHDPGAKWEWFVDALDLKRIIRTLDDFPVDESLYPVLNLSDIMEAPNNLRSRVIDSEDNDRRYNPAFLIPLILGTLNDCYQVIADHPKSSDKNVACNAAVNEQRHIFVLMAQKLCRKGAMALALASLAAACCSLRQTSICVLYLLLHAMQASEARLLVSWKERPQLEMILNSLQRGLLVHSMAQIAHKESNSSNDTPTLPTVSSIFLAKASLIVSQPTDDMYPAINRFFLRINAEHGAYSCHSLPAFMSLFFKPPRDAIQAQRERIWALQLLKEGIVDSTSLSLAVKNHIPELLMTTFDSSCRTQHDECSFILDTMSSMFDRGSSIGLSNIFIKMGLFPWILVVGTKLATFKEYKLIWKLLTFTEKCLCNILKTQLDPILIKSIHICLLNIASFAVSSFVDCLNNENIFHPPGTEIYEFIASNILITIHAIILKTEFSGEYKSDWSMNQYELVGVLDILSCVKILSSFQRKETSKQLQLAHAICYLPLEASTTTSNVILQFAKILLTSLSKVSDQIDLSNKIFTDIMHRVRELIISFPSYFDADFVHYLIIVRRVCRRDKRSWDDWLASVSNVLQCSIDEEEIWNTFSDSVMNRRFEKAF